METLHPKFLLECSSLPVSPESNDRRISLVLSGSYVEESSVTWLLRMDNVLEHEVCWYKALPKADNDFILAFTSGCSQLS